MGDASGVIVTNTLAGGKLSSVSNQLREKKILV